MEYPFAYAPESEDGMRILAVPASLREDRKTRYLLIFGVRSRIAFQRQRRAVYDDVVAMCEALADAVGKQCKAARAAGALRNPVSGGARTAMSDQKRSRVLDLRSIFGVEAQVTASAEATGGAYVEMDCTALPGSGTMVHLHPEQEETFRVLEGTLEILRDGKWSRVPAGESAVVPRGAVHAWRNAESVPLRFVNVHQPAGGFQDHMETLDRLVQAGKVKGTKDPRSLMHMCMSAVRHRPDVAVKPPQWVVNGMAWLGRRLGYTLEDAS